MDLVAVSQAAHNCCQSFKDGTGVDAYSVGVVGKSMADGDRRCRSEWQVSNLAPI